MCHPDDLPEGYHTGARAVGLRQADKMALGRRGSASRAAVGCDQMCDQDTAKAPDRGLIRVRRSRHSRLGRAHVDGTSETR